MKTNTCAWTANRGAPHGGYILRSWSPSRRAGQESSASVGSALSRRSLALAHLHTRCPVDVRRLPHEGPVLEVAVTPGEAEPLHHPTFDVCGTMPAAELIGVPACVADDLSRLNAGRYLCPHEELAHVIVHTYLVVILDSPGECVSRAHHEVGVTPVGLE